MKCTPAQLSAHLSTNPRWTVSLNRATGAVTYRVGERVVAIEVNGECFLEV